MKKILFVLGLIVAALLLMTRCGDTIIYNYGDPDVAAEDDGFAEDNTSNADNMAEPDKSVPLTDAEEWAPGCDPPFPDGTWVACKLHWSDPEEGQDPDLWVGACQLVWDKSSCTASSSPDPLNDGECWRINDYPPKSLSNACTQVDPPKEDIVEETDVEEWAPGCNPPWPDGTGLKCKTDEWDLDYCLLSWDKSSCTASCWNPDTSDYFFQDAPAEAVSGYLGCSPTY